MIEYLGMFEEVELRSISIFKGKIYGVVPVTFELSYNFENKRSPKNYRLALKTIDGVELSLLLACLLVCRNQLRTKAVGIHQLAVRSENHVWRKCDNYLCFLQIIICDFCPLLQFKSTSHTYIVPFQDKCVKENLGLISSFRNYLSRADNDFLVLLEYMNIFQCSCSCTGFICFILLL